MSADTSELCDALVTDLAHSEPAIRTAAAEALAAALTDHHTYIPSTLDLLLDVYTEHLKVNVIVKQLLFLLFVPSNLQCVVLYKPVLIACLVRCLVQLLNIKKILGAKAEAKNFGLKANTKSSSQSIDCLIR